MKAQDKIGKYLTIAEQEKPGVGTIWRAAELAGNKIKNHVLIDEIDTALAQDAGFTEHFLNQSQVTARLEHPNILQKVEALQAGATIASVYEFHEGFTLARVLERCQADMYPFTVDHGLLVVSKLLSALAYTKSKHLTHGFVNPSQVYVTHEGEIKLKGFAFSSALRACRSAKPNLGDRAGRYIPKGTEALSEDRDRLDIYACGAILFEMLVGEPFNKEDGDAAARISNARTDNDSEPIPPKIAKIMLSALDASRPDAYRDIQKMAKDMDELLFSGEYSPTTFNLAFFMHSAFREEMESMGETVKQEREKTWGTVGAAPAAAPPPKRGPAAAPKAAAPKPAEPPRVVQAKADSERKSKLPLILGAVAVVLVIVVGVTQFMPKGDDVADGRTKFEKQADEARKSADAENLAEERQQFQNVMEENRALREEIRALREEEKRRQIAAIQEETKQVEAQMAELAKLQAQSQKTKAQEAELAALRAKNEELLEQEREARKKLAESEAESVREALAAAKASESGTTTDPKKAESATAEAGIPSMIEAVREAEAEAAAAASDDASAANPAPAKPEPPATKPADTETGSLVVKPKATDRPPVEGEIVDLDDELLERPVVMSGYETLEAPRKAVKLGYVKRDGLLSFVMKILVDEDGRVEEVMLLRSPIPRGKDDLGMVDKAVRATKKLRYSEPSKMGVRVKTWAYVAIHFKAK